MDAPVSRFCRYFDIQTKGGVLRLSVAVACTSLFITVIAVIQHSVYYNRERNDARGTGWSPVDSGSLWIIVSSLFLVATMMYIIVRGVRGILTSDDRAVMFIQMVMCMCVITYAERNEGWHVHHIMTVTPILGTMFGVNGWLVFSSAIVISICEVIMLTSIAYYPSFLRFTVPRNVYLASVLYVIATCLASIAPMMFAYWLKRERQRRLANVTFMTELVDLLQAYNTAGARKRLEEVEKENEHQGSRDQLLAAARKLVDHIDVMRQYAPNAFVTPEGFDDEDDNDDNAADEGDPKQRDVLNGVDFTAREGLLEDDNQLQSVVVEKSSFKKRWSTVLHVHIANMPTDAVECERLSMRISEAVISRVMRNRGVVDRLAPNSILATFNCHLPCVIHETEASNCALNIAGELSQFKGLNFCIVVASGYNWIGSCGTELQRAKVVIGDTVDIAQRIPSLAYLQLGCRIVLTEDTASKVGCEVVPIDAISPAFFGRSQRIITLYELRSSRKENAAGAWLSAYSNAFSAFRQGNYMTATQMWRNYVERNERDIQAQRLLLICERMEAARRAAGLTDEVVALVPYLRRETPWEAHEGNFLERFQSTAAEAASGMLAIDGSQNSRPAEQQPSLSQQLNSAVVPNKPHDLASEVRAQFKGKDMQYTEDGLFSMFIAVEDEDTGGASKAVGESAGENGDSSNPSSRQCTAIADGDAISDSVPHTVADAAGSQWQRSETMIGEGAFSKVYLSLGEQGNLVAMKCFSLASTRTNEEELIKEVDTLSRLRDDYIVGYVSYATTPHHFIILMEYVSGGSLHQLLQQFGSMPPAAAKRYFIDICKGLRYLHANGITHCDIKPHNVLLSNDGTCKLSDFGSSVGQQRIDVNTGSGAEAQNIVRGTSWYMAPECARGEIGPAIDIWSLGVTLLEMLTRTSGWQWTKGEANFIVALGRDESMIPTIPGWVPSSAADVIRECCQRDPAKRPPVTSLLLMPFLN